MRSQRHQRGDQAEYAQHAVIEVDQAGVGGGEPNVENIDDELVSGRLTLPDVCVKISQPLFVDIERQWSKHVRVDLAILEIRVCPLSDVFF
jgi:hypothetical protein